MYFSDVADLELKQFHKVIPYNFNISLTKALSSDLFHIETIIQNKLYRIFPLFYCEKITSSNPEDIILENKGIICNKNSKETFFNFISDDNDNVILNRQNGYCNIGDVLSDEDFNAVVQLLRANNDFSENIQINNSTVKGEYGTYIFNLNSATIVDNGVLITNETLSSIGTVKLVNPTFKNSRYQLKLSVYSLSDVNVLNENYNDNISRTDLIIDLAENTEVNIPFNTLDLNCIVGFNAAVSITHDLAVIQYPKTIILTSNKSEAVIGDAVVFTARYLENDSPLADQRITFKNNGIVLGTAVTNENGIATYTRNISAAGDLSVTATDNDNKTISNLINVAVRKKSTNISFNVNKTALEIDDELVMSGVLKSGNELLTNRTVRIFNGNQLFFNVTTDAEGSYYKAITVPDACNYDLKAYFEGDSTYASCGSEYVNVKVEKKSLKIQMRRAYFGETVIIEAIIRDPEGTPFSNAPLSILLKEGDSDVAINSQTNSDGELSVNYPNAPDFDMLYICYTGEGHYKSLVFKVRRR